MYMKNRVPYTLNMNSANGIQLCNYYIINDYKAISKCCACVHGSQ
jgi:hypothetical protein